MTTPYMSLNLPTPSVTSGPAWASALNAAFTAVDGHDHSPGFGRQVRSAGLSIDADLAFGGFNLTGVRSVRLSNQASALSLSTDIGCVYEAAGNLYYNNSIGQQIQITAGAGLNASSIGGIGGDYVGSGASVFYTSASQFFTFWQAANTPANMSIGTVYATGSLFLGGSGDQSVSKSGGALFVGTSDSHDLNLMVNGATAWTVPAATGDLYSFGHAIRNLPSPALSGDAANKGYVDTGLALKAPLASPTFTGTVTVPTLDVSGTATVPTPSSSSHAATKGYVDGLFVSSSGTASIAYSSGWSNYGSTSVRKTGNLVVLQLNAQYSGGGTGDILTIPSGYRPNTDGAEGVGFDSTSGAAVEIQAGSPGNVRLGASITPVSGHRYVGSVAFFVN